MLKDKLEELRNKRGFEVKTYLNKKIERINTFFADVG